MSETPPPRPPEPGPVPAPPDLAPRIRATLEHWKRRLLDLSKRNRLLNFKPTPVSTVALVDEEPAQVFGHLWIHERPMKFKAVPAERPRPAGASAAPESEREPWAVSGETDDSPHVDFEPYEAGPVHERHTDDVLQTASTPEQLDRSLRRIDDQARLTLEEQGVNTLFMALGMLAYRESADSEELFRAPLVLLPVALERGSARAAYVVVATDDDVLVNPALVEYLRQTHNVTLPELPDPEAMEDDSDLSRWLREVAATVAGQPGWAVQKNIYLGLFSFQKFVMYKDLEQHASVFEADRLVQQLVSRTGGAVVGLPDEVRAIDLDREYPPESTFQVVDADSSQLRAMAAVARGHDLVLEGPPGTGKSQTITNLIAQALAGGKRVLFVAEKMAALDVVHRRLAAAGLGEFCLEIHSTKANKRAVIQQIKEALDASLLRPTTADVPTGRLKDLRRELTDYVVAVHQPYGALGTSPYRAFGELGRVLDAPKVAWSGEATAVGRDALEQTERDLEDLAASAALVGDPLAHPWRNARKALYTEADLDEIRGLLTPLAALLADTQTAARDVARELGLPAISTAREVETAVAVAELLGQSPGAPLEVLRGEAWNAPPPEATALVRAGREVAALRHRVRHRFRAEVLEQEHAADIAYVERQSQGLLGWLAFLDPRYRAIRRRWRSCLAGGERPGMLDLAGEMRVADQYRHARQALAARDGVATALFGPLWRGEDSDWDRLDRYVAWVVEFRQAAVRHRLEQAAFEKASRSGADLAIVTRLFELARTAGAALERVRRAVDWPAGYLGDAAFSAGAERVRAMADTLGLAPRWAAFEMARAKVAQGLAREALDAALRGEVAFGDLVRAFHRAFLQRWLAEAVHARAPLRAFQSLPHERRIAEFRTLDRAVLEANRAVLVRELRDRIQEKLRSPEAAEGLPVLRREMARQRALRPLRKTMQHAQAAIRAIKPCFLMSPLTVAQLLSASAPPFDLVIFDEASQVPAEDAAGAIVRGQRLVVVGDPKQLPPTNFFAVMSGHVTAPLADDGTPLYEDSESVLEDFMAAGLPMSRLRWHYRSAHESLITFSNVAFYEGDLYTFPSAATSDADGLQFELVEAGVYEGKGLNLVEARRVADAVVEHARRHPELSLGVGTFNLRQQVAIQDELEVRRRQDPSLEGFFGRGGEPFFVKNLENIQGDERDVIFISVTYAKAADGRLRYNFGPLNTQNGWRRLNVLITRARRRLRVFASIRGEEITPAATASDGPRFLREFLVYAEHKRLDGIAVARPPDTESPFERDVHLELTRRGVTLQVRVGLAGYRIDFGVVDDSVPGRFVCGIECDGVAYHDAETARDRDRLRHEVLERRGWTIHRVWSTDWFKDRSGQIERLIMLIEESRKRAREAAAAEASAAAMAAVDEPGDGADGEEEPAAEMSAQPGGYVRPQAPPYRITPGAGRHEGRDLLSEPPGVVRRAVEAVVQVEAPVHVDDLTARVAGMWGVRVGSRIEAAIRGACRQAEQAGTLKVRGQFVWAPSGPPTVRSRSGARVAANRIPPEEYREAVLLVLRASGGLPRGQLVSEVRAVLGFARAGNVLEDAIGTAIEELVAAGIAGEGSAGLKLRQS